MKIEEKYINLLHRHIASSFKLYVGRRGGGSSRNLDFPPKKNSKPVGGGGG